MIGRFSDGKPDVHVRVTNPGLKGPAWMNNMNVREKLAALNLTLPPDSKPGGSYIPAKRIGNLIYVAGQIPMKDGKLVASGQVPSKCSIEQARLAARQCVLNAL